MCVVVLPAVYVIDTGLRTTHLDFRGRVGDGASAVGTSFEDDNGHGTHVSGESCAAHSHSARSAAGRKASCLSSAQLTWTLWASAVKLMFLMLLTQAYYAFDTNTHALDTYTHATLACVSEGLAVRGGCLRQLQPVVQCSMQAPCWVVCMVLHLAPSYTLSRYVYAGTWCLALFVPLYLVVSKRS
jgi:hypothetical protein